MRCPTPDWALAAYCLLHAHKAHTCWGASQAAWILLRHSTLSHHMQCPNWLSTSYVHHAHKTHTCWGAWAAWMRRTRSLERSHGHTQRPWSWGKHLRPTRAPVCILHEHQCAFCMSTSVCLHEHQCAFCMSTSVHFAWAPVCILHEHQCAFCMSTSVHFAWAPVCVCMSACSEIQEHARSKFDQAIMRSFHGGGYNNIHLSIYIIRVCLVEPRRASTSLLSKPRRQLGCPFLGGNQGNSLKYLKIGKLTTLYN